MSLGNCFDELSEAEPPLLDWFGHREFFFVPPDTTLPGLVEELICDGVFNSRLVKYSPIDVAKTGILLQLLDRARRLFVVVVFLRSSEQLLAPLLDHFSNRFEDGLKASEVFRTLGKALVTLGLGVSGLASLVNPLVNFFKVKHHVPAMFSRTPSASPL
ncbi:hypothetical protein SAICODRAFT_130908 [Saitoella complicata NRRL Y-17804]|uniref:uncharacterized protein n=1 Tax=Saitoella complicata (strain BCRC 22490 / CBS 7301 / JCM 7358 / NBRC 10748 / NRRL Y-17804) TaxID=698492 RepID=UPI00086711FE|nr:uncharacterized protein SAICODRAFT_130908 [Saitoella complicata NRRL Y-17804]ODQ52577.1 hypothetical protein SAICODRAFT_130908 [Saitoella complicata NRRL Y-17804]